MSGRARSVVVAALVVAALLVAPLVVAGQVPASAAEQRRLAGADRWATAAAAVRDAFPTGPVPVAVVASGEGWADALAGGPAAAALGGPVLPVARTSIPAAVRAELERLAPERVLVLGGPGAVGDEVLAELSRLTSGEVRRVAGPDRYATAAAVAREAFAGPVAQVLVATGAGFADALAAGAVGARTSSPVLLVEPGQVPAATAQALRDLQPSDLAVLGGTAAVSDAVLDQLRGLTTGGVTRLAGADRYGTAALLARWYWPDGAGAVHLATGQDFPDALAGTAAAARDEAPLLLVRPGCVPVPTGEQLQRLQPSATVVLGGTTSISPGAADGLPCAPACPDVFPAAFADALARDFPGQRVTAAVHDQRTGCRFALHPGLRLTTASAIKAGVLGAVLLQAQDEGRGLTDWERARTEPMIRVSHDNPYVSDLYGHVGGVAGMDAADRRWGATSTTNTPAYGATWTTAEDRTRVALGLLHGPGPLTAPYRAEAWREMTAVHPTQSWGITAGLPAGWTVALKNGFYPMRGYGWRAASTGFARDEHGSGWAVTVLTDGGSSQLRGMELVETVTRRVAAELAGGTPASRPYDRAVCTDTSSGESWATVAHRVGAEPAAVQYVSGGTPSPLQGQRACSPDLRP